jgi:hypothetical protein
VRVTPEDASDVIRRVAGRFLLGEADVREVWSALHSNLSDLCRHQPLSGDFLDLFTSLEQWEAALPGNRQEVEADVRAVAGRLAGQ